jgi:large repetitive protein
MTTSVIRSASRNELTDIFRRTAEQLSLPVSRRRHRFFRRLQVEPLEERRPLAAGSLDSSFDGDGIAITSLSTWLDEANSVAVQWDGKIVAAGRANTGSSDDFAVVRYNANGSLDTSFSADGKVTTAIGTSSDTAESIAVQPDGKLVVAGTISNGGNFDFALVRYNPDGSLDGTFDSDGIVTTGVRTWHDTAKDVALQPDGKIVVVGYSQENGNEDFAVVRYNPDGSLDSSFDADGKVTTAIGTFDDLAYSVVVQPDGKLVVAGVSYNGSRYDFAVVRYNTDGSLDTSFSGDGAATTAVGMADAYAYGVALQSDGKIVVAGYASNGTNDDFAAVRFHSDGSLDTGFDGDGIVMTAISAGDDVGRSVLVQGDGKIVMAGYAGPLSTADFALVRYNPNGSLDANFDADGKATTSINALDRGHALSLQSDGTLVAAGFTYQANRDFAVVRYQGDANSAPTDIDLSHGAAAENQPIGTVVGYLQTVDPNLGAGHTYALVPGAGDDDNASFTIVGNELKTAVLLDYEAKNSYSIRVQTTDRGGLSYGKSLSIAVTDQDEWLTLTIAADQISESGGSTTAAVTRNNAGPALTVSLVSNDTTEASVPAQATIPAGQTSATFSINAVDDELLDGTVTVTVTASAVGYADGVDSVVVSDYETVTVTFADASIAENGGTTTGSVRRSNTDSSLPLTVTLLSNDIGEATVPAQVTIPADRASATFAVTGVDDSLMDGTQTVTVTASAAGYVAGSATVNVTDDDTAGITVSPTGGLTTTEAGGTATFTVVLTSQPTAEVTIGLSSGDTSEGTLSPASVTFTAANWNTPQTVTASGVNDDVDDGEVGYTILTAAATSTDANYNNLDAANVSITNTDNDTAGITVSPASGLMTTEGGGTATFTIVLNSQPTADVTIGLNSGDTSEGTVSPASVTFTVANWSVAQAVTVTGVNDGLVDGNVGYLIVTSAAASSDPLYEGLNAADIAVTNQDNDPNDWDFGDAPDAYSTSLAADGARHEAFGPRLGTLRDLEPDAATPRDGTGDDLSGQDDEDGVVFTSVLRIGGSAAVEVTVSSAGVLNAWLDANADNDWSDAGEHILVNQAVLPGVNRLTFPVPAGAVVASRTYARFRLSTQPGLAPIGWAADGEVEDEAVSIWPSTGEIRGVKWLDRDGDGVRDGDEPVLPGWKVFLDENQNGKLETGETSAVTAADGSYAFTGLEPAEYVVAEVLPEDWEQTAPGRPAMSQQRVSVSSAGTQGNKASRDASLSGDGRYVAFSSFATNLVAGDTNNTYDIFVFDRQLGTTERVNLASGGVQANQASYAPKISADGRYVAFISAATNLVAGDTNGKNDIFVADRQTGVVERVSVSSSGTQANDHGETPTISADGRFVAWMSSATNLAAEDTNGKKDIFVYDRQTATTELVSVSSAGGLGNNDSESPTLSADGRYVAFDSTASNLVAGDSNFQSDIFVRDRQTGTTQRVSVSSAGVQGDISSRYPSLSSDGRYVAYMSGATNLVAGDTNREADIFVYDRDTGQVERVSVSASGTEANDYSYYLALSGDGRFVAYRSSASNLVVGDVNRADDIFVYDRQTGQVRMVTVGWDGSPASDSSDAPAISSDGAWVAYMSSAANLVAADTNGATDVFVNAASGIWQAGAYTVDLRLVPNGIGRDFGNRQPLGSIRGVKWQDVDGDGIRDVGEPGLADWTIYLDQSGNGQFDSGERSTLTDAQGQYVFSDLPPGTYRVAEVLPPGWQQTSPGGPSSRVVELGAPVPLTFDFEDLAHTGTSVDVPPYQKNGFIITSGRGGGDVFRVYGPQEPNYYTGSAALMSIYSGYRISLRREDGLPFTATSVGLSKERSNSTTPTVWFTGIRGLEAAAEQKVTVPNFGIQPFSLTGFADILALEWTYNQVWDAHQFDALVLSVRGALDIADVDFGNRPRLTVAIADDAIVENAGAAATTGTITRGGSTAAALTVHLTSSDPTEATVPATVTILAGQASAAFAIDAQDDFVADGVQPVTVTATATGYVEAADQLDVTDNDTAGITISRTTGLTTSETGGTDTFSVQLNSQPTADVTIGLSSSDASEGTVSPASVTFTGGNWNTPQIVTVSGVNDDLDDGDVGYTIVTATATSADGNYNSLNPADVSVTNTDNDTAEITVSPTSGLVTTESGDTAAFTIVLNTQPTANVTIGLSSSDASEGTVSPASVTFTGGNWNTPQIVTVSGVNDDLDDGDVGYTIVTATATSADGNYNSLNPADVSVTNTDNDTAEITVSPTSGLVTTESGDTAAFTIVLNTQPTANVTIGLSSSDASEGTVSPASVTYTAGNWNLPQTVTVSGLNDDLDDGDVGYTIVTAAATSADGNYNSLNPADVLVTNTDNDTAGITVSPTSGLITTESGGTAAFTIVLNTQPTANVTIGLSSSDASEGTVSPASVTYTAGNWNLPQTVTVSGLNDDLDDGDVGYTIVTAAATSADGNYNSLNAADVSVTNTDNDTAGITVSPTSGLITTESGGTATFTIVLNTQPTANVTIGVSSSDASEATVSPASVTFTAGNWNLPQIVTVSGVNDDLDDGDVGYTIVTAAATSADGNYNSLNAADVSVTNTDNDTAGITVSPTSGLITTESGGTATFTIVLNTQPTANVTIGLSSSDASEGTVSPASVTFTGGNWNLPQIVMVSGVNDDLVDGDVGYTIFSAAAVSADANYNSLNAADISVTNTDNDTAGITVSPTSGLITTESGGTASFTIVLNTQPTANVTIGVSSSDASEGTVSPASVTFTAGDWNSPQTVTVSGVDDALADGDVGYTIVTVAAISADGSYNSLNAADVSVTNTDNDTAGITVSPTSGLVTTESGGTATFTIVLNTQPTANVTIGLSSSDAGEGIVSPTSVTFTAGNWNVPQTVTVTGVNDNVDDGDVAYTIVTAAAVSSDGNYSNLNAADVSVTNTDNDTAGITVSPTTGLVTTESGGTATFAIALNTQPTADVTIGLSSSDASEGTVAPTSVTFTAANWNAAQTVTVTGVNDDLDDGDVAYTILTAAATSTDANYSNMNAADASVTNTDNDTAGITVNPTSGLVTTESGGTAAFTIVLNTQPTANVTIGLSSSDTGEGTVSPASVTFTAANWNAAQTVTITGVNDDLDDGDVSYTIVTAAAVSSDANYSNLNAADASVTNTDDDTAGITVSPTSGLITTESGGAATFTIALSTQPTANVTIGLSSSDASEGTVSPASVTFTAGNWNTPQTVTITGVNDDLDDGDVSYTIVTAAAVSSDANYSNRDAADVSIANTDDDTAGITVTPTSALFTTESGGVATFTIVLNSQPTTNVMIGLSSSDTGEGTVSPASVTFTAGNWSAPQTVTLTGVNDDLDDGDVSYTIVTAAAVSTDANYSSLNAADVSVTNTDDDTAGITVNPTSGLVTTESGGVATFTIVLNSQPTADVTIGLSSSDAGEGTVSPASVTFTAGNWSAPQTVTVSGVNDDLADGNVGYTIVTATAVSSDANYSNRDAADVSIANTDNDTAGITVTPTGGLITSESGGTATFTIVLNTQPTASVTIGLNSSDASEGAVSPASVTFTADNWNTPQTVTVSGVNDDLADGDVGYTIATAATTSADGNYNSLNAADVSITNTDDDTAGITVSPASGLITTESGGTATFTIVLNSQPTADVTIGLSSSDAGEGTVSPASVTFTAGNWNTPQTVTVSGVNDDLDDGDASYTIVTAAAVSMDGNYSNLNAADVSLTNTDDDTAGITVSPTSGLITTESGGIATFTIVLNSQPTSDVTIGFSSSDASEGTVSPASATFTAGNWNAPRTVTVGGVNDDLADGNVGYTIVTAAAVSADANYNGLIAADVSVTNTDDDTAGITVSPTSGLITTESGGTATFTIVLNSQPTADVTIGLSSSDASEGTVSPASVTFTAGNWSAPRTVTVSGVDDDLDDGDVSYTIVTAAAVSTDGDYSDLNAADVSLTNANDDTAGITVNPTSGLITAESGGIATFTIVLNSQPTADVTIGFSSSDASEGTVSPASATFTAGNWNAPRTVTVSGVNDDLADGNVGYTIVTAAAVSADANYNGLIAADVSVTNTDDDTAGITVSPTSGLITTESGGTAMFTIVLNTQPTANVTIGLSSSDASEGTVSPASVTFTAGNWNSPQIVTVSGVNDHMDDGEVAYAIVTAAAASADANYSNLNAADVSVTNIDNDTAGITVSPNSGLITSESGGTATFTLVLDTQPVSDVVIGIISSDLTEGFVFPASVRFTSANWDVVRTVTVFGEDDPVDDGDVTFTVFTGAAASMDVNYSGLDGADVSVTNLDNDTAGITVGASSRDTTESGGMATFTIALNTQPTADVTIGLSSSDASEGSVTPTSVTFTAANWNILQIVTVSGVNDNLDDGDVEYTIVTAAAASADANYNGANAADVSVTNSDDDTAGISVSPTGGLITTESGGTATYTVVLNTQPTANVTIGLTTSDASEGVVSPVSLTFTAANWNSPQIVTVTGVDDDLDDGEVGYTIFSEQASSADASYSNLIAADVSLVNTDNDTAEIAVNPASGLMTSEAGGTATFTIVLGSQPTANVTIALTSNDTSEGTVSPTSVTYTAANWRTPQIVTVTGVNDDLDDGDVEYTIVTAAATSADANYNGLNAADVSATNTDNDTAGISVSPTSGLVTTESGGTAGFTIVLNSQPTANVTIDLSSSDVSEGSVSPASLTFTAANWSLPRIVTVTGIDDELDDGGVAYTIVTAAATSADANYNGLNAADVSVTNTDDDTAGITVSPTSGQVTTEAGGTAAFTIALNTRPTADVTIGLTSSDSSEGTVSPSSLTFTAANWSTPQIVTVTGVDDNLDDGDVAYTIVDGSGHQRGRQLQRPECRRRVGHQHRR